MGMEKLVADIARFESLDIRAGVVVRAETFPKADRPVRPGDRIA